MSHIVFLQNAWSPVYAGRSWPRRSWLRALERSRSGTRLKAMLDDLTVCHNTTPLVGESPQSVIPADSEHIKRILSEGPQIVVACGRQAEAALAELWQGPLLCVPHPAHRLLTDLLYLEARRLLANGFTERLVLRQRRGEILREPIT